MDEHYAFVAVIIVLSQPCLNKSVSTQQVDVSGLWWIRKPANQCHDVENENTIDLKLMAKKTLEFTKPEEHLAVINELHKYLIAAMRMRGKATVRLTLKTDGLNLFDAIFKKDAFPCHLAVVFKAAALILHLYTNRHT